MFKTQIAAAIAGARTFAHVDGLARDIWRAHASGALSDDDAQSAAEAVQARKATILAKVQQKPALPIPTQRKPHPRSPDRAKSIERRRRWAASGAMPPQIAAGFTQGEAAALAVIARQVQHGGTCSLPVDAIAALAGVSRTTAQNAIRQAKGLGLIHVQERRRRCAPSLTNIVTVADKSWSTWLKLSVKGGGLKKVGATVSRGFIPTKKHEIVKRSGKRLWKRTTISALH